MAIPPTHRATTRSRPPTPAAGWATRDLPTADGRLRALWRILIAVVASIAVVVLTDISLAFGLANTPTGYVVATLGRVVAVFGVLAVTARWLDRRRLRDYGLAGGRGWWADLGCGAAVGLGMFALSAGAGVAAGWIEIRDTFSPAATGSLWLTLAVAILRLASVSLWEEVLFRGVMIRNAAESFGQRWPRTRAVLVATTISTAVFALIHVPQHIGADDMPLARMAIMWVSLGGLLALPYLVTGQLAVSLGLHLTINLALQHVFVLWDEQAQHSAAILHLDASGAELLAGVGGALQLGAIPLGYLAVLGWLRWRCGTLRIHPSLTELPTAAPASSPAPSTAPEDTDEGPPRSDTAAIVRAGCATLRGPRPWRGTEGP